MARREVMLVGCLLLFSSNFVVGHADSVLPDGTKCYGGCPEYLPAPLNPKVFRGTFERIKGFEYRVTDATNSGVAEDGSGSQLCRYQYFVPKQMDYPYGGGTFSRYVYVKPLGRECLGEVYLVVDRTQEAVQPVILTGRLSPPPMNGPGPCIYYVEKLDLLFWIGENPCSATKALLLVPRPVENASDQTPGTIKQY